MDGSPAYSIILFVVFIFINIVMYGFSSAIKNINESQVAKKAEEGSKKAAKLLKIIENPSRLVNTIQLTATCISMVSGVVQSIYFIDIVDKLLEDSIGNSVGHGVAYVCSAIIVVFAIMVILLSVGVMIPKKLGLKYADSYAYNLIGLVTLIMTILRPITAIIEFISNIILRIMGIDPKEEYENVTEDEIISIVNEGHEQGVLEEREAEMISNIIELDEKTAGDIMTHRKNIVAVDGEISLDEAVSVMLDANNSRFPVYVGDIDNVVGIVHLRDAVECMHKENKNDWLVKDIKSILRSPRFIPETKNIDALFKEMQSEKIHMVIVLDEYGQTSGIVAMEDILEEIVGNIMDEYDEDDNNIVKQSAKVYLIKGMTPLEQIEDELNMKFEEEDYETLNGYLISKLDRIPSEDDKPVVEDNKYRFEILAVENKMISLVKLTIMDEEKDSTIE